MLHYAKGVAHAALGEVDEAERRAGAVPRGASRACRTTRYLFNNTCPRPPRRRGARCSTARSRTGGATSTRRSRSCARRSQLDDTLPVRRAVGLDAAGPPRARRAAARAGPTSRRPPPSTAPTSGWTRRSAGRASTRRTSGACTATTSACAGWAGRRRRALIRPRLDLALARATVPIARLVLLPGVGDRGRLIGQAGRCARTRAAAVGAAFHRVAVLVDAAEPDRVVRVDDRPARAVAAVAVGVVQQVRVEHEHVAGGEPGPDERGGVDRRRIDLEPLRLGAERRVVDVLRVAAERQAGARPWLPGITSSGPFSSVVSSSATKHVTSSSVCARQQQLQSWCHGKPDPPGSFRFSLSSNRSTRSPRIASAGAVTGDRATAPRTRR